MAEKFTVEKKSKLLDFLFTSLSAMSKKSVKQKLASSSVSVNEEYTTKHDFALNIGDIVQIGAIKRVNVDTLKKLNIIYQDKDLIAINKPAGLLSVSSASENKQHALNILRNQLSGKNEIKLWPVHRLDRDTSGILLFATSKEVREAVMDEWKNASKTYLAIVNGIPKKSSDTITQPLRLDDTEYKMHVGEHVDAKSAITHYKVIRNKKQRALLEVNIETGRQHQIRAHLAWMGNSIIGDERYGKKGPKMGLHACKLKIFHPILKKEITFEVDAPNDFYQLLT